jgi:hypothetical protein
LSIVTVAILALWFVMYCFSDPSTHWGAFFGNAIADWCGSVVVIVGTKYLIERGSQQSRQPADRLRGIRRLLWEHSLTIFLLITGVGWVVLFAHMQTNGKWGQVSGNIVSEWVQTLGIVYLTKSLVERGSADSN